jgi:hypothetical protein
METHNCNVHLCSPVSCVGRWVLVSDAHPDQPAPTTIGSLSLQDYTDSDCINERVDKPSKTVDFLYGACIDATADPEAVLVLSQFGVNSAKVECAAPNIVVTMFMDEACATPLTAVTVKLSSQDTVAATYNAQGMSFVTPNPHIANILLSPNGIANNQCMKGWEFNADRSAAIALYMSDGLGLEQAESRADGQTKFTFTGCEASGWASRVQTLATELEAMQASASSAGVDSTAFVMLRDMKAAKAGELSALSRAVGCNVSCGSGHVFQTYAVSVPQEGAGAPCPFPHGDTRLEPCTLDPCPTCWDNILNADETGTDCGGSCNPCCSTDACGACKSVTSCKPLHYEWGGCTWVYEDTNLTPVFGPVLAAKADGAEDATVPEYVQEEPAPQYECNDAGCKWSDYAQGVYWDYYDGVPADCESCTAACTADPDCGAVECGDSNGYCAWWAKGSCELESATGSYYTCRALFAPGGCEPLHFVPLFTRSGDFVEDNFVNLLVPGQTYHAGLPWHYSNYEAVREPDLLYGWEVALKTNGDAMFQYDSPHWTSNTSLFNAESPPVASGNAKYPVFNDMPFYRIRFCVGEVRTDSCSEPYKFESMVPNLANLFAGTVVPASETSDTLLRLLAPTVRHLQMPPNTDNECGAHTPGFNVRWGGTMQNSSARWGFCATGADAAVCTPAQLTGLESCGARADDVVDEPQASGGCTRTNTVSNVRAIVGFGITNGQVTGSIGAGVTRLNPAPPPPPRTCKEAYDAGLHTDGVYTFEENVTVYCDMTTDGGGWTLVMNINPHDGNSVGYNNQAFWTAEAEYGCFASRFTHDYKHSTAYTMEADELVPRNPNPQTPRPLLSPAAPNLRCGILRICGATADDSVSRHGRRRRWWCHGMASVGDVT